MTYRLVFTKPFVRDYQSLPDAVKQQVDEALALLRENPRHPSLQSKKMQPKDRGIFEARVTQGYRLTFCLAGDEILLRRAGAHDILRTP